MESQLKIKQEQVSELESQAVHLRELDPTREEEIKGRKSRVEERFKKVLAPLQMRRLALERVKKVHQFLRDMEDEKMWIEEKMPQATNTDYGNSLLSVQMLLTKNQSLRNELDSHEPRLQSVCDVGRSMIEEGHPQGEEFQEMIDDLNQQWDELIAAVEARRQRLVLSEIAQQVISFFHFLPTFAVSYLVSSPC